MTDTQDSSKQMYVTERLILVLTAERDRLRAALARIADQDYDRNADPTGGIALAKDTAQHALRTEDSIAANRRADEPEVVRRDPSDSIAPGERYAHCATCTCFPEEIGART